MYQKLNKNYTQIPNVILDAIGEMSESEMKLTLCIARHTFGYHVEKTRMTYELMEDRTGMSRGAIYRAIDLVEERGFFRRGRKSYWFINSSNFELCYDNCQPGNSSDFETFDAGNSSDFENTKRKELKNTTTSDALALHFLKLTGIDRPHESTDFWEDDWERPFDIWLERYGSVDAVKAKIGEAIQHHIDTGLRFKSPKSLMTTIANSHAGKSNGHHNHRSDKQTTLENIQSAIQAGISSRNYQTAVSKLSEYELKVFKQLGSWYDVKHLSDDELRIKIYQGMKL